MAAARFGIWLIGARGGVGASALLGLAALRRGLTSETGLVSSLPQFEPLELPGWDQFAVGGHEIRDTRLVEEAAALHRTSRVFQADVLEACQEDLAGFDQNIVPGIVWNVGPTIRNLATMSFDESLDARQSIAQVERDLNHFQTRYDLDEVVVVNIASTEALLPPDRWPASWAETEVILAQPECPLPASSLYAIAALGLGMSYVNFTPSLGATPLGIDELARMRSACHAGRDGKTGETLLKSVLAPMFAARNLHVMSWVGHNIFGNLDGKVLDDPVNKASKVRSKDHLLSEILGYPPQTLVTIEHIASMADWKTAWDHIHFQGFLGTPMTFQFNWQGCDSLLAAPLVLDLVRLTLAARRRGETGALDMLGSFFKSPIGTEKQAFFAQFQDLLTWAQASSAATCD